MILIDTDICIELLRGNKTIIEKRQNYYDEVAVSFMTVGELFYSAEKSSKRIKNIHVADEFLLSIVIIHSDMEILKKFGELKVSLYNKNLILPDADLLIASTALIKCDVLVTGNIKHFNRIEHLKLDNWLD